MHKDAEDIKRAQESIAGTNSDIPLSDVGQTVAADLVPGSSVCQGRYQIIALVGQGAIGAVYHVEQVFLKKNFALKTLHKWHISDVVLRRFQKEATAASRLEHPNLVRAIDFGLLENGLPFLVMDFIEGESLADYLRRTGRLSIAEMLSIFIPLCAGLAYAHDHGVIHRDLKPANIMLQKTDANYIPRVVDFGLAQVAYEAGKTLTQAGEVFGTPLYMSPEQCRGAKVDLRSDIYSLGCVIFEVLTGAPPFGGESTLATMMQHQTAKAMSLKEASFDLQFPQRLENVITKMLEKNVDDRYRNFSEIIDELKAIQSGADAPVDRATTAKNQQTNKQREQQKTKSLTTKVAIGLSCLLTLGVICGSITLLQKLEHRQSPPLATTPVSDVSHTESPTGSQAIDIVTAAAPASIRGPNTTFSSGNRQTTFPVKNALGDLTWFEDKNPHSRAAKGIVTMPAQAKPILTLENRLFTEDPAPLSSLRKGDIYGAVFQQSGGLTSHALADPEVMTRALANISALDSLQLLWLFKINLVPKDYKYIGQINDLRWLSFNTSGDGKDISKLPNLGNVRLLMLNDMKNVSPIFARLSPGNLTHLYVSNTDIKESDLSALAKMRNLTTLVLKDNANLDNASSPERTRFLQHLLRLHKLKRLCLDSTYINDTARLQSGLPSCEVSFEDRNEPVSPSRAWFNPRKTDPRLEGIW